MFGKRKKFSADDEPSQDMSLQITSMADIFTIILVFLLKSFSTGLATITPAQGMQLPSLTTQAHDQIKEALRLEVLSNSILLDGKQVIALQDFKSERAPASVTDGVPVNPISETLYQALMKERQRAGKPNNDSDLMLLADEHTPYDTLQAIMNSAANAGYVDLQLVVIRPQ